MKIVDCFMFYNELDLLNYRFNLLNDIVDWFVVVEATHTHSGKEKPLWYEDNKIFFEAFHHKIIHVVVDDFPYKYPQINYQQGQQWKNEHFQRDAISRGLNTIKGMLSGDDVMTITDLDEIPDPRTLAKIKAGEVTVSGGLKKLEMDFYYYNLNTKQQSKWVLAKIATVGEFNSWGKTCTDLRHTNADTISNGGWHLSYFGDSNFIKNKIVHFAHQEFNRDQFVDMEQIKKKVDSQADLFGYSTMLNVAVKDNTYLPLLYETYLGKYYKA